MRKSYIERLLDELKLMYFELHPDATFDDWSRYQCELMQEDRDGE